MRNKAKPRDITGSLVHYKKKGATSLREERETAPVEKPRERVILRERAMAFDSLTYGSWLLLGVLLAAQLVALIAFDII